MVALQNYYFTSTRLCQHSLQNIVWLSYGFVALNNSPTICYKNSHIIYPYSQSWYFFQFFIANIFLHCKKAGPESKPSQSLLTWEAIHRKMPWSLVLLLGGGFALAKASTVSGLSAMMGHQLETLGKFWLYVKELERSKVIWNKKNSKYLMQCMILGKPMKIPKEVQKGLLNPELYKVQSIDDGRFSLSSEVQLMDMYDYLVIYRSSRYKYIPIHTYIVICICTKKIFVFEQGICLTG